MSGTGSAMRRICLTTTAIGLKRWWLCLLRRGSCLQELPCMWTLVPRIVAFPTMWRRSITLSAQVSREVIVWKEADIQDLSPQSYPLSDTTPLRYSRRKLALYCLSTDPMLAAAWIGAESESRVLAAGNHGPSTYVRQNNIDWTRSRVEAGFVSP